MLVVFIFSCRIKSYENSRFSLIHILFLHIFYGYIMPIVINFQRHTHKHMRARAHTHNTYTNAFCNTVVLKPHLLDSIQTLTRPITKIGL